MQWTVVDIAIGGGADGEGASPLPCLCLVSSASRLNTYRLPYACNPPLRRRVPVHSSSKPLLPEGGSTWGY